MPHRGQTSNKHRPEQIHKLRLDYGQRVRVGILLLTMLVSLVNVGLFTRKNHALFLRPGTDTVSMSERRFIELKRVLPARGTVGYISELVLKVGPIGHRDEFSDEKYELEYALTQYSLAPLIVDIGSEGHELVVGNFKDTSKSNEIAAAKGLTLVKDFGNGIMLFSGAK